MDELRVAPTVGIVASLGLIVVLGLPYLVVESATGVASYYGSGAVNPLIAGLFALITIIVFAAGREGRSDPGLVAGVALALGVAMTGVTLAWALTVRVDTIAIQTSHRWLVVGVASGVPVSGAWFARALGVL